MACYEGKCLAAEHIEESVSSLPNTETVRTGPFGSFFTHSRDD